MTTLEKRYNAAQPRVPRGVSAGGQWTAVGAWATSTWTEALRDHGFGAVERPTKASAAAMRALDAATSNAPVKVTRAEFAAAARHYRATGTWVEPTVRYNAREEPTAFGRFTTKGDEPVALVVRQEDRETILRTTRSNIVMEGPRAPDGQRTFYRADTFARETARGVFEDDPPVGRVVVDYILPRHRAGARDVPASVWLHGATPQGSLALSARRNDGIAFDERATRVFGQYSRAVYNYLKFIDPGTAHRVRTAVSAYQFASSPINDALRGQRTRRWALNDEQARGGRQHAATMLKAFRKHGALLTMRAPFDLYRGVKGDLAAQIMRARVGTRLHDGGFSSFSLSTTAAESFGPVVLRIRRGRQVRALPAIRTDELEFILDAAQGFEIVRKKKRGNMILVDVRPIDLRPRR